MPLEVALMLRVSSDPACHNIVRLLDWFEQPKHFVMIMERPDPCEDLVTFYERYEDTDEEMAKAVIMQLISALKHCESRGVLHRDIKPENILVCTDTGEVKLLDFGCGDFLKNFYRTFAGWCPSEKTSTILSNSAYRLFGLGRFCLFFSSVLFCQALLYLLHLSCFASDGTKRDL